MKTELISKFLEKYGHEPTANYFTPGRVNLIGEHIDYNGGLVMPCAVTLGTWLSMAPNEDNVIRFKSLNFPEEHEFPVQSSYTKTGAEWYNYPLGVFNEIIKKYPLTTGLDLLFFGNIPIGSGLSSSASIEVAMAYALNSYFNLGYEKIEIPLLAQKVENEFIGVNCGIMDQFAVAFGETDKAIVLNCDTLHYKIVDCNLGNYRLAIINTNKPRKLAESKYNQRVAECQTALKQLNKEISLNNLCELNADKFDEYNHLITDPIVLNRATHVVNENDRVNQAAKALNSGNLTEFGRLMYASHQSLKDLYEVTGAELDAVVEFCSDYEHVIGARMTGAGFGGCAIALLKKGQEDDFTKKLTDFYTDRIGYAPTIYISEIGTGASVI
ncbi:galactokinase [Pedobacter hiemivivus]|uniref:Galactokinase n=1 Tax=Pedobacter hiemivivus TaxID=2530454 RepID=A0A4V5PCR5_9SPHI|nr:galactokinase [Pedobacter hiemivivus]TCC96897.1 galactokinase [Pedobacter hiemivivus]TKC57676.1 galactokinase [Pedobacter hiemivivus]